jgi:hypothetical protein
MTPGNVPTKSVGSVQDSDATASMQVPPSTLREAVDEYIEQAKQIRMGGGDRRASNASTVTAG